MPLFFKMHKGDEFRMSQSPTCKIRYVDPRPGQSMKDAIEETQIALVGWFEVERAMWDIVQQQFAYTDEHPDCKEEDLQRFESALEVLRDLRLQLEKGFPLCEFMEMERMQWSCAEAGQSRPMLKYKHHTHLNFIKLR